MQSRSQSSSSMRSEPGSTKRMSRAIAALVATALAFVGVGAMASTSLAHAATARVATVASAAVQPAAATHDSTVFAFGGARFAGSPGVALPSPLVGVAGLPDGSGYWVAAADGSVYHYGAANFLGSPHSSHLHMNAPVVGIASDPKAPGYWVVTSKGQVFAYGAARWFGAMYPTPLPSPIVGITPTPSGLGYWLAVRDGGVFSFGDASFHGSAFGLTSGAPVVGIAATALGGGYWLVDSNGGLFTFGTAAFHGSAFGRTSGAPVVGMARTYRGLGYYLLDSSGGVYAFGDGGWQGSARTSSTFLRHGVGIVTPRDVNGYWLVMDDQVASGVVVAPGQTGAGPAALQGALLSRGFWLQLNGVYDTYTTQAVYAFQKITGRARTGVVTMSDWLALQRLSRPAPRSSSGVTADIDLARQVLILANNGVTTWIFNTSTGSGQPYSAGGINYVAITPTGHFTIWYQIDALHISHLGAMWRPKYFTTDGVAIHGSPSIPPYPASHGCVRLTNGAMDYVWAHNLLPLGTAVWVY
jgi:hypothetical protein